MANEKTLNTRIRLKYDSLNNWTANDPTLLEGELAIAYLGPTHTTTSPDNGTHPVLFKVGPGKFSTLPFASALAADVYAWAKQTDKDFADNFLSMVDNNGATMQSKLDAIFATDTALNEAIEAVRQEITNLSVSALESRVKTIEDDYLKAADIADMATDTEVADAIKVETDRATAAEEALGERIDAIDYIDEDELTTALTPYAKSDNVVAKTTYETDKKALEDESSAIREIAEATKGRVDTFLDGNGVADTIDSLKEIQAELERLGEAVELETQFASKADKVIGATAGNFASLDGNGNLIDSGKKASDFAPSNIDTGVHSVTLASGTNNGTLKLTVDGTETDNVAVTGLGSAAFKDENAFAPADNYALKSELPSDAEYGVLSITGNEGIEVDNTDAQNPAVKIADHGISATKLKADKDYAGEDAEVWVFYCGTSEILV